MQHKRTIRTLSHCFYDIKYHLVWTPKYRGKVFTNEKVKGDLKRIFEYITKWKHWEIIELNIQIDRVKETFKRLVLMYGASTTS